MRSTTTRKNEAINAEQAEYKTNWRILGVPAIAVPPADMDRHMTARIRDASTRDKSAPKIWLTMA